MVRSKLALAEPASAFFFFKKRFLNIPVPKCGHEAAGEGSGGDVRGGGGLPWGGDVAEIIRSIRKSEGEGQWEPLSAQASGSSEVAFPFY